MSFAGAPVSKALVIGLGVSTTLAAVTSRQYLFDVPWSPHLTRDWQLWRVLAHHFVFTNSSEVFLTTLIWVYTAVAIERNMGTLKFASFLVVVTGWSTLLELAALVVGARFGFRRIPAGPFAITFAIIAQSLRLVPTAFYWKVFGLEITNRVAFYVLASQLLISQPPASLLLSCIGFIASQLYLSNTLGLRYYRIPPRLFSLLANLFSPLLGDDSNAAPPPNRHTYATLGDLSIVSPMAAFPTGSGFMRAAGLGGRAPTPAPPTQTTTPRAAAAAAARVTPVVVPVPPPPPPPPLASAAQQPPQAAAPGFVQQWSRGLGSQRAPSAEQIAELAAIFPDRPQTELVAALSSNELDVGRAAAFLLQT